MPILRVLYQVPNRRGSTHQELCSPLVEAAAPVSLHSRCMPACPAQPAQLPSCPLPRTCCKVGHHFVSLRHPGSCSQLSSECTKIGIIPATTGPISGSSGECRVWHHSSTSLPLLLALSSDWGEDVEPWSVVEEDPLMGRCPSSVRFW